MADTNSNYESDLRSIQERELAVLDEIEVIQSRNGVVSRDIDRIRTRTMETIYEIDEIIQRQKLQEGTF